MEEGRVDPKIIYYLHLKFKGNTPYPILLVEACLSPIESMTMFRYLMFKNKFYNMEAKRFPKMTSKSNQNSHLRLTWGWHKDVESWLDHWGIKEEIILRKKDNIKDIVTSKFKGKLWDNEELDGKGKLRFIKK